MEFRTNLPVFHSNSSELREFPCENIKNKAMETLAIIRLPTNKKIPSPLYNIEIV